MCMCMSVAEKCCSRMSGVALFHSGIICLMLNLLVAHAFNIGKCSQNGPCQICHKLHSPCHSHIEMLILVE